MAKNISDLKDQGFVPKSTLERMAATESGQLAALIDQILYDGDVREVNLRPGDKNPLIVKHFSVPPEVYSSAVKGGDNSRHDVRKGLIAIREYLEACALRDSI